jgi:Rad3-related DNA helicase
MHWDWPDRRLKLSVGELARFSLAGATEDGAGRWRAELGSHWHDVLREHAEAEGEGWQFEQAISGWLMQAGWRFELQGRIDQLRPGTDPALLREVKTITLPLPADEAQLRERYPAHFHQAMLYAFLLGRGGAFPRTELLFLEIQSGLTQTVELGDADLGALHAHLQAVAALLEERRAHFSRLRALAVPRPFPEWRPGQAEARKALAAAMDADRPVLFEAPTGFGKTGLVLEQALLRLASGEAERLLILTGKNTGHSAIIDQLADFKDVMPELTLHALRSRKDHALDAGLEAGLSTAEIIERWRAAGLSAQRLLADGILSLEDVRGLGQRHGIPPWAVSRMLLPYADAWVADFNYLFDPAVAGVLEGIPAHDPARTLLIIDEAHNLPERAAASRSHLLDAAEVAAVQTDIQFARFPGKLPRLLDQLQSLLRRQPSTDELDPVLEADLIGLLREAETALRESHFDEEELSESSREWLWNLPWLLTDWDHPDLSFHLFSPGKGRVQIACLDASAVIAPVLDRFHRAVLMSATLRPWSDYQAAIGLPDPQTVTPVLGHSPWLEGCFEVMVDARVDTRYRQRDRFTETTARAIAETALTGKGCTAAFFPSYRYAETVLERLAFLYPGLRARLQPRDLPLEGQQAFLENALQFDDILFLVLGSRFSEGIDAIGGRVSRAIVVSPALPEVNGLQKARESRVPGGKAAAFRTVYLIPGMRKIAQALGRLVRSPGHQARVLLHGKRFMEPEIQDLLPEYLRPLDLLVTDEDFDEKWLHE